MMLSVLRVGGYLAVHTPSVEVVDPRDTDLDMRLVNLWLALADEWTSPHEVASILGIALARCGYRVG